MSQRPTLATRLLIERPGRTAAWILAFHAAAWTLVPWLVNDALPLDTIEALAWGREWRLGYDKHPPASAWAAEIAGQLAGRADLGLYALSALCTAAGLFCVWRLAADLLSPPRAVLALLLAEGVYYHHFTAPEFNVNVLQIPLWAAAILAYSRGVEQRRLRWWVLLGLAAGLALLSKYLAGALLIAFAAHAILYRRDLFRRSGPYLAAAVCALVFVPHALWMVEHDFITLAYGVERAGGETETALLLHLTRPASFLLAQLAATGGMLWLLLVWVPRRREPAPADRPARRFLATMTLAPVGALALLSLATGFELRSMWATPMLVAAAPAAMAFLSVRFPSVKPRDGLAWAAVILVLPLILYAAISATTLHFRDKPKRVNYPGPALAAAATDAWRASASGPLLAVVGSEWEGGLVGWYAQDRPSVYIGADPERAQWMTDELVRDLGAVVVWTKATDADAPPEDHNPMPANITEARFGPITPLPDVVIPYPSAPDKAARFGLAIIHPRRDLGGE